MGLLGMISQGFGNSEGEKIQKSMLFGSQYLLGFSQPSGGN